MRRPDDLDALFSQRSDALEDPGPLTPSLQAEALLAFARRLEQPMPKSGWDRAAFHRRVPVPESSLEVATGAYWKLLEKGGNNRLTLEEDLLNSLSLSASPKAIPFWVSILGLKRSRDAFAKLRRGMALAALALVAYEHDDPDAHAALLAATHHEDGETRATAAASLTQAFLRARRRPSEATLARLRELATDKAFAPRFMAHRCAFQLGAPLAPDNPGGTYAFEMKLGGCSRTLELRSTQSLDDLCLATLQSVGWDRDHPWIFFLSNDKRDTDYAWPPHEDDAFGTLEAPAVPYFAPALGDLGLGRGHSFLLLFDYGDKHWFRLKVASIKSSLDASIRYPRVVATRGASPEQYDTDG